MKRVYRISKCAYINDLKGSGAASYPGRWHSKGTHILYTAANPSLALLESVVHMSRIAATDYCMTCLEIPEKSVMKIEAKGLPPNWRISPPPDTLKEIGDQFIRNNLFLGLLLPSVIMPDEANYLLNPGHPEFKQVKVIFTRKIDIDQRLLQ